MLVQHQSQPQQLENRNGQDRSLCLISSLPSPPPLPPPDLDLIDLHTDSTNNNNNNHNNTNNHSHNNYNDNETQSRQQQHSSSNLNVLQGQPETEDEEEEEETIVSEFSKVSQIMSDAYLSSAGKETMALHQKMLASSRPALIIPNSAPNTPESLRRGSGSTSSSSLRDKREKMEYNQMMMMRSLDSSSSGGGGGSRPLSYHGRSGSVCLEHHPHHRQPHHSPLMVNKRHIASSGVGGNVGTNVGMLMRNKESLLINRRSMPNPKSLLENRIRDKIDLSELDTNLPRIDLEAIELHLRQAREEERKFKRFKMLMRYHLDEKYRHYKKDSRFVMDLYTITYDTHEKLENLPKLHPPDIKRRSDREEIRRRLALEADNGGGGGGDLDKHGRKHNNLHGRLQSSMNLQICFMNETASDSESPNSDTENSSSTTTTTGSKTSTAPPQPLHHHQSLPCLAPKIIPTSQPPPQRPPHKEEDFFTKQAKLQAQARSALSQAKEVARLALSQEREGRLYSPITEMVRNSLEKVGVPLPPDRRRASRQILTEMNVAQLQVIVNDLHSHIEKLNENLVSMLLERDDLHMEQDSMLVDIEDLTRYLAAKHNSPHQSLPLLSASQSILGKK